jgi:Ca2+-binding RTX toxin-like protein
VILGGAGGDDIDAGNGHDVVVGDHGEVYEVGGVLRHVKSALPDQGGVDTIALTGGDNTVIGGQAGDFIDTGVGADLIIGDSGEISYGTAGGIHLVTTVAHAYGGNDTW